MRLSPHTAFRRGHLISPTGPLRSGRFHSLHHYYGPADFPPASPGPSSLHLRALRRSVPPIPHFMNTVGPHCTGRRDRGLTDPSSSILPLSLREGLPSPPERGTLRTHRLQTWIRHLAIASFLGTPHHDGLRLHLASHPPGEGPGSMQEYQAHTLRPVRAGRNLAYRFGGTVGDNPPPTSLCDLDPMAAILIVFATTTAIPSPPK